MSRSRFATDTVNYGELQYLWGRYDQEDVGERVQRIEVVLRRLIHRRGLAPALIHKALGDGIRKQEQPGELRRLQRGNALRLQTRRALDNLLACVDRQLPTHAGSIDLSHHRDRLFRVRRTRGFTIICIYDGLMQPKPEPARRRGRPVSGRQVADEALHAAGVADSDRAELLSALGLDDEETIHPTRRGGRTATGH
jgi:hypothetical protein